MIFFASGRNPSKHGREEGDRASMTYGIMATDRSESLDGRRISEQLDACRIGGEPTHRRGLL